MRPWWAAIIMQAEVATAQRAARAAGAGSTRVPDLERALARQTEAANSAVRRCRLTLSNPCRKRLELSA